jgi:antitoxin MazE
MSSFNVEFGMVRNYNVVMKTKSPPKRKPARRSPAKRGTLTAKLVKIGNSRGVRLPDAVLKEAGLSDKVEISVQGDRIVISAPGKSHPRAGWEEQFKKALAEHGDDTDDWRDWQNAPNEFDEKEWTW